MFLALNSGQLPRQAPMFLESREWEGNVKAYAALTELLARSGIPQEKRTDPIGGGYAPLKTTDRERKMR